MSEQKTITLTLTEEEVELIEKSICAQIVDLQEVIKKGDKEPTSDYWAKYAAEAKANIPVFTECLSKITKMEFEQKYPLLGGQET